MFKFFFLFKVSNIDFWLVKISFSIGLDSKKLFKGVIGNKISTSFLGFESTKLSFPEGMILQKGFFLPYVFLNISLKH